MPTLGTQTISSSFAQLLKTFTTGGLSGALQVVTDGDDTSSALSLSTTGVSSTGSFSVTGDTTLTGAVTFGSSLTASTGTATIGTLFASGPATFGTNLTASTGTATLGTIASTTINNTGLGTVGTLQVGASGPKLTAVSFGTAAFTSATVAQHNSADATTGSFGLTGVALGDMIIGSLNSLGSATGTVNIVLSLYPAATNFVKYSIQNQGSTAGTIPAGTFFATALRFTA
jgi:hypothetical protein